jgi:hypothetical protein
MVAGPRLMSCIRFYAIPFKRYNDMPVGNPLGSGGLFTPSAMVFGPDGNLYISGGTFGGNLGVRRYNRRRARSSTS